MNEFGWNFNGVDFSKLTPEEKMDWLIRFNNTVFNQNEDGVGQHKRKAKGLPKTPIRKLKNNHEN